jgi:glycosyltransferase involved in cell wall biosynthesis
LIPVCRAAGASLTVHFHGFDAFEKQTLKDYEAAYREVFASRARIVVVSREMEKQLISLGARAEQVFWNPCGVNLEQFRAADAGKNDPCFLAVGRFVEKKAPYLTLLAFARAAQEVPEARLEMVGDGPLRSVCEQMEAAMRSAGQLREGQVRFLGPRNSGEIAGLLRQARAFVQHSIRASNGDAEGTPVAILEAAATGLPVISTRHMGIPEAVVEGQTGWNILRGTTTNRRRSKSCGELRWKRRCRRVDRWEECSGEANYGFRGANRILRCALVELCLRESFQPGALPLFSGGAAGDGIGGTADL